MSEHADGWTGPGDVNGATVCEITWVCPLCSEFGMFIRLGHIQECQMDIADAFDQVMSKLQTDHMERHNTDLLREAEKALDDHQ